MIVSVHIPKTAGTSLRVGLEQALGARLLLDYGDRPLARSVEDDARRARSAAEVRADPDRLVRDYDAVHGHFLASKYLPLGERARFAVFLREPVTRTLSQYRHWRRAPNAPNPIAARIRDGEVGPADLAEMPEYRHIYADFLGGIDLARFAFVGLAEQYDTSLALFRAVFGIDLPVLHENAGSGRAEADDIGPDEMARVKAAQADNALMYDRGRRRFEALCTAFL
jgi:hypothetical protein